METCKRRPVDQGIILKNRRKRALQNADACSWKDRNALEEREQKETNSRCYLALFRERIKESVRQLKEGQLDFEAVTKLGLFPLHEAVVCGYLDCAKSLIELGAELTQETPDGLTPLEVAVMAGNFDAAALLIQHGAPVDRIRDGMPIVVGQRKNS